jgi:dCTP deaminase
MTIKSDKWISRAQILFFESDEICETSYKDRGGKYQGQVGVTLPKM